MASSKSAKKRIRQNESERLRNRAKKAAMRTQIKKVYEAISAGDANAAQFELIRAVKLTDKTAKTNTIHANAAARIKSQLARAVNAAST